MDVSRLEGRHVAITGAGSGIGRATALAFARRGGSLELCDLSRDRLEAVERDALRLGAGAVHTATVDVASAEQMERWAADVHARVGALDVLVNNAGVAIGGGFLDTSLEDWAWILGINTRGVVHGCHFFLPPMVAGGRGGHVVNVASAAGLAASEVLSAYSTTKFSVVGLSEALRLELEPHRIGVTCVCPGFVNTPITRATRLVGPIDSKDARAEIVRTYEKRNYGPERVADGILRAIEKDKPLAVITPEAYALYYLKRFAPGVLRWASRRLGVTMRERLGLPG
ncbi:MAG: SDR family NAD(P)-dependent oxidoreductase [Myxococcota bacterium]